MSENLKLMQSLAGLALEELDISAEAENKHAEKFQQMPIIEFEHEPKLLECLTQVA